MNRRRRRRAARSLFRSLTFRLGAWYAGMLLVALAVLGALALYSVRRAVVRTDEVVVHERLERHTRRARSRRACRGSNRPIDDATELEGEHGPVRVRDSAGRTLFKHGDVDTRRRSVVSTSVSQRSAPRGRLARRIRGRASARS